MIGLVVNPVAGLGGAVGLKGTDGMVDEALARGAVPRAGERAALAVRALPADVPLATAAGAMGADAVRAAGREPALVVAGGATGPTADDTRRAVAALADADCELILFAGGHAERGDAV
ncbi:MAG: ATP-NAD kinase, partial [Actinomycetota bacterium]